MNILFTSKGRFILILLLIFYFGLKLQASTNIRRIATNRMVCDTDTTKKAPTSRIIKTDTTLILKAGTQILKNADTIVIINGVPTKVAVRKPDVKSDPATTASPGVATGAGKDSTNAGNPNPNAKGLIEVKNDDSTKISIVAPPTNGTIQVKNTATAPPANTTIVSPPSDGIIQVKDGSATDSTNPGNGTTPANSTDPAVSGKTDTTAGAGKKSDATTTDAGKKDAATDATTTSSPPINGEIQVKNVDSTMAKKGDTTLKKSDSTLMRKADTTSTQQDTTDASEVKAKGYYVEVGGPGLAISANYDARFGKQRDGWGYRIGLGGFVSGGNNVITVPFQVNYLIGNHSSMFEIGAGTTFLNSNGNNKGSYFEFDKITGFIATASIGYRYQPEHKGLNFRIAFVPLLTDEGMIPIGGLSVGYTFK